MIKVELEDIEGWQRRYSTGGGGPRIELWGHLLVKSWE